MSQSGWFARSFARSGVSMSVSPRSRLCATRTRRTGPPALRRTRLRARAREATIARVLNRSPTVLCRLVEDLEHAIDHQGGPEALARGALRMVGERPAPRRVGEQVGE